MAFNTNELSNFGGSPVSLYEFVAGPVRWNFASSETAVVASSSAPGGTSTYAPIAIKDSGVSLTGDPVSDDFVIEMQMAGAAAGFLSMFSATPPSNPVIAYFRQAHRYDLPEAPIMWAGTVSRVKRRGVSAEVICTMLTNSFARNGLRLAYQRTCPYALYDPATCRASRTGHSISGAVSALSGTSIQSLALTGATDQRFSGGYIEWTRSNGVIDRRAVEYHHGPSQTLFLLGFTDGLEVGTAFTVWDGCIRTPDECNTKFNNLANYGGFPHLPGKSPFDGEPVF